MSRVWDIPVQESTRVRDVRVAAEAACAEVSLDAHGTAVAALVATELATNLVKHAGGGRVVINLVSPADPRAGAAPCVQIVSLDHGPGIGDVRAASQDGYTTAASSLGAGLGTCRRVSDDFDLHSRPGEGTVAVARISPTRTPRPAGSGAADGGVRGGRSDRAGGSVWSEAADRGRGSDRAARGVSRGGESDRAARGVSGGGEADRAAGSVWSGAGDQGRESDRAARGVSGGGESDRAAGSGWAGASDEERGSDRAVGSAWTGASDQGRGGDRAAPGTWGDGSGRGGASDRAAGGVWAEGSSRVGESGRAGGSVRVGGSGVRVGGITASYAHAEHSGDAFGWVRSGARVTLLLADGLGHGEKAAEASTVAVEELHRGADLPPADLLRRLHTALRTTRGAAVGVAQLDEDSGQLSFAGVGNIGARLRTGTGWQPLISHPGIVGAHFPATVPLRRAAWQPDSLLVLHSDGLPSRWVPPLDPLLLAHDPAVVAAVVLRDSGSAARPLRDDTSVAVLTPATGGAAR